MPSIPQQYNEARKSPFAGSFAMFLKMKEEMMKELEKIIDKKLEHIKYPRFEDIVEQIKGLDGEDSDPEEVAKIILDMPGFIEMVRPEDGHTPTREELLELIKPLIPKPRDGYTPIKGKDYFDGKDGYTPIKGKDYFDGKQGNPGKDGSPDTPQQIVDKLNKTEELVDQKVIKGLTNTLQSLQRAIRDRSVRYGGGGDVVEAGTNVSISRVGGKVVISSTGGSGFTKLAATGDIDNSNVTFTFASKPTYIVINGVWREENYGWTWDTLTATLSAPVGTGGSIFGIA